MTPHQNALVLIETMRRLAVTSPAQQVALLYIYENPDTDRGSLERFMQMTTGQINGLMRSLMCKGLIVSIREDSGPVRPTSNKLTKMALRAMTIGGDKDK